MNKAADVEAYKSELAARREGTNTGTKDLYARRKVKPQILWEVGQKTEGKDAEKENADDREQITLLTNLVRFGPEKIYPIYDFFTKSRLALLGEAEAVSKKDEYLKFVSFVKGVVKGDSFKKLVLLVAAYSYHSTIAYLQMVRKYFTERGNPLKEDDDRYDLIEKMYQEIMENVDELEKEYRKP